MLLQEAPGSDLIILITSTPPECFPLILSPTVKSARKHVVCQLQEVSATPAVPLPRSLELWTQELCCAPAIRKHARAASSVFPVGALISARSNKVKTFSGAKNANKIHLTKGAWHPTLTIGSPQPAVRLQGIRS